MGKLARETIEESVIDRDRTVFWTPASGDITKTLELYEQIVYTDTSSYAGTITMPSVAEAQGITYTVTSVTVGNAITLQDNDDSYDWNDYTLDTANDYVALRSDGRRWIEVEKEIT